MLLAMRRRDWRSRRLLRYERNRRRVVWKAWCSLGVGKTALVTAHLEVMRLNSAVRSVLDFKIPKDIFLDGVLDGVVDGCKDPF